MKSKRSKRCSTLYKGVFFRESTEHKHNGKPDRYFLIRYRIDGKAKEEGLGWSSETGLNAKKASLILAKLKLAQVAGTHGRTLQERRQIAKEKKEAEKARKEQEKRDGKTFAEVFQLYIDQGKADMKRSCNREESLFRLWIDPDIGELPLTDIGAIELQKVKRTMKKAGQAPRSIEYALAIIRQTFNFAYNHDFFGGDNPTKKIKWPKFDNQVTEDLTPKELTQLLEAIEQDDHPDAGAMMKLGLFTGLRRGELFKLKWEHIDFERGFIHIKDPKGGPDEVIPLNDLSRQVLEDHPKIPGSPFVFPGKNGKQRVSIHKAVNKIKKYAGLPKNFRPLHGLRHTFASGLASSGKVDLYTLQKLLTHKTPQMTQRYAHLRDEALRKASDVVCQIFSPKPAKPESKAVSKVLSLKK